MLYKYRAKVLRIIDGDTMDVDLDLGFDVVLAKQRVRLYGIDTPESRTRDKVEKKFGLISKDYVKKRCPVGSKVIIGTHVGDERGKFGRILGEVFAIDQETNVIEETSINRKMINESYAVEYHGQAKEDIEEQHLENRGILERRGEV
jgi:micrococcal nuclease